MTHEEALDVMKGIQTVYSCKRNAESIKLAIEALQKQIPMKCKKRYHDDEDEETGKKFKWEFDLCPVCDNRIALREYLFCPYCGQALDRSKT